MNNGNINYTHKEDFHNEKAGNEILPYILSLKEIKSVIDIGCGTGSWLSVAKKLGINDIFGVDGIKVSKDMLKIHEDEFKLHNLTESLTLNRKFDLAICLEVVEHLPHEAADNIIDIITKHSDFVLFSAAIPYQTGDHHINEQWPNYWQQFFETKGFFPYDILRYKFWDNENIDWWYRQNIMIYSSMPNSTSLGHPATEVLSLVHPELLLMKESDLKNKNKLIDNHILNPTFISSLKKLLRSILN